MSKVVLRVKNLSFVAGNKKIVDGVSFDLLSGQHLAIVGPSGGGKSTLLRLLNRLIEPSGGSVYLREKNYKKIPPRELRQRMGMLLQRPHLFPETVADNLRFGPMQRDDSIAVEKIDELLKQVDLEGYADRKVDKLSGGEMQRVSLARTLANSPCILLLDEPTSALDKKSQLIVEKLICKIARESKLTFVLVTHDDEQAKRLTKRTILIDQGKVKASGLTEEILDVE